MRCENRQLANFGIHRQALRRLGLTRIVRGKAGRAVAHLPRLFRMPDYVLGRCPLGLVGVEVIRPGLFRSPSKACYSRAPPEERQTGVRERPPMPSAKLLPPIQVGFLQLRVRGVDGGLITVSLPATDHRIVLGQDCDYLIGNGIAHAFSKEGLFIRSGPVPITLEDLHALSEATHVDQASGGR